MTKLLSLMMFLHLANTINADVQNEQFYKKYLMRLYGAVSKM